MPADNDIADHLATLGHGTVGTDIFYSSLPDSPDVCVCVIQTGGQRPAPWEDLEYPGIQIVVRDSDSDVARTKAEAIFADLAGLTHTTINTRIYHYFESTGSPNDVGLDEKNRRLITIPFIVTKDMEG